MRGWQMFVRGKNPSRPSGGLLARLASDRRGVAAIEFAFIAPLLLALYFVTMEVSQAIESNKKVSRVGSMVGDLVTQQQTINKAELEAIMRIGEATLQPYNRTKPEIIVTAIEITDEASPKTRVVWSRKLLNGTFSAGAAKLSATTVPPKLNIKGTFLVRVESKLNYSPMITWSADQKEALGLTAAFSSISMHENYYLRPRLSTTIPCADC
jgi:Flp pilus assembly protein TadG